MKLSVIIVSYNVKYYLEQCIHSVKKATEGIETEIFVVDNHSRDKSVPYLSNHFHDVNYVESNHNLGFARGNNIAIRQSVGEYVLLLNPDTFVTEGSIRQVLDFMDAHPKAGGVGVRMYNTNGTVAMESRRGIPTPVVSFLKMCGNSKRYYMSHLSWDEPAQIEIISGAFCMLRRQALEQIGLLDETFFMYGEDIDLSYRLLKGGWENWYVPAKIVHYKGESTHKSSFRYVHVFYQAMLIFFRKHYGHLTFLVTLPVKIAIYLRAIIALFKMQYDRMRHSLGFYDHSQDEPNYLFYGAQRMLDECRKLARRKGLMAQFVDKDSELAITKSNTCVVFDTDYFSYEQVVAMNEKLKDEDCFLGTYSTQTHHLITPKEVY